MKPRNRKRGGSGRSKYPAKGALIKGMSKRLADAAFKDGLHAIVKDFAGVCVLYHGDRPHYVGLINLDRKVHPSTINAGQWEWMKRYRVWEANRTIFLFPENWLEPEPRDDKTRNLGGRVNQHLKDRHRNKWDGFCIFRIKRVAFLKDLETLLVRIAESPGDRPTGHVSNDSNLPKVLRKVHRQRGRALRRIEKAL